MRVGLISDLHGNRPAFESVLADMPAVDRILCAGDVVGYYPWPGWSIDAIRDRDIQTVSGNHDRAVATNTAFRFNEQARAGVLYARDVLTDEQLGWLADLPTELTMADGAIKVIHGHPADPDRYTHPPAFSPNLLGDERVLVLGHTHVQHVEGYASGIVVNPGSVGQPRDGDPRAAYAVLDVDAMTVETRRVEYDIDRVQREVQSAGLPERLATRLSRGR